MKKINSGNKQHYIRFLIQAGNVFTDLDNHQAKDYFETALGLMSQENTSTKIKINLLNRLAVTYRELGNIEKSNQMLLEALYLLEERPHHQLLFIKVNMALAINLRMQNKLIESKRLFKTTLSLARTIGRSNDAALILSNLAPVYCQLGRSHKAIKTIGDAHALVGFMSDSDHINLAYAYRTLNEFKKALDILETGLKAHQIRYHVDNQRTEHFLILLFEIYLQLKNFMQATQVLNRCICFQLSYYGVGAKEHINAQASLQKLRTLEMLDIFLNSPTATAQPLMIYFDQWDEQCRLEQAISLSLASDTPLSALQVRAENDSLEMILTEVDGHGFFEIMTAQLQNQYPAVVSTTIKTALVNHIAAHTPQYYPPVDETHLSAWAHFCLTAAVCRYFHVNVVILRSDDDKPQLFRHPSPIATLYIGYQVNSHYIRLTPQPHLQHTMLTADIGSCAPIDISLPRLADMSLLCNQPSSASTSHDSQAMLITRQRNAWLHESSTQDIDDKHEGDKITSVRFLID